MRSHPGHRLHSVWLRLPCETILQTPHVAALKVLTCLRVHTHRQAGSRLASFEHPGGHRGVPSAESINAKSLYLQGANARPSPAKNTNARPTCPAAPSDLRSRVPSFRSRSGPLSDPTLTMPTPPSMRSVLKIGWGARERLKPSGYISSISLIRERFFPCISRIA